MAAILWVGCRLLIASFLVLKTFVKVPTIDGLKVSWNTG
jgi:hypothetical protein